MFEELKPFNKEKYVLWKDEKFDDIFMTDMRMAQGINKTRVWGFSLSLGINLESFEDNQFTMLSNTQLKVWVEIEMKMKKIQGFFWVFFSVKLFKTEEKVHLDNSSI